MDSIARKEHRIVILLFLIIVTGTFWYVRFGDISNSYDSRNQSRQIAKLIIPPVEHPDSVIEPNNFRSFSYQEGDDSLHISDECNDTYYAVLIFPKDVDYRTRPNAAIYNTANECAPDRVIDVWIGLSFPKIEPGTYYYFVADQGNTGGWYNPR